MANSNTSRPTPTPSPASSPLRVFARHPRLTAAGIAIVGVCFGFRHVARSFRENELRQKSIPGNRYVSVERSGGGL
ncbi:predicted protein [Chaetomium globosum CBS 148.51]|uniref:HIG1 domain-containing protein n=1 Tax=Chaetomium globosum (strain ATCC 6205 / CBS 148.51 / DSM 1962 / NBRC 6347 / NRRL 1970) TaxID=306901 RepID=Q2H0G6_CHAGB|nr:uncharacterized protein CHGG_04730 [Chaetomium globosum CBS 148.51]EAQ88111.1 predicted protein [Chaetomium globosum CBS 148.51]